MDEDAKLAHGTAAWFRMVGNVMRDAALQANLPPDTRVSLVERYTDGIELAPGLVQGLRFEIADGRPAFRVGARPDELADIVIEVTKAASHRLNTLYGADPAFQAAFAGFQRSGALKVTGALSELGDWFGAVHDRIVDRTRR